MCDFPYEYEFGKLAIDVINGGPALREWVDAPDSTPEQLESRATDHMRDRAAGWP